MPRICLPSLRCAVTADLCAAALPREEFDLVVIEAGSLDDAAQAFEILESESFASLSSLASMPVWIYYPEATISCTVAFLKAGAAHVAAHLEEIADHVDATVKCNAVTSNKHAALQYAGSSVPHGTRPLIGVSRSIRNVAANIEMVASRRCNVLIEGETGTGKEVVARSIHQLGSRARGPWVAVNCGAIPESLLEAELFGHVRGAFTGAVQARAGKFEAAHHGTIFLDEIAEMPLGVQARLLRVLQEREVERLGGNEKIPLDVRVIAATNADLAARVAEGSFRRDLYFRLNVFRIGLSPLRERPADIPPLAEHFVNNVCAVEKIRPKTLDASALALLMEHDWPGNARELENAMETAVIRSGARANIGAFDIRLASDLRLASDFQNAPALNRTAATRAIQAPRLAIPPEGLDYQEALHALECDLLAQAISRTRGNKSAAADLLRLKRTTLSARMRVLEARMPRLVA